MLWHETANTEPGNVGFGGRDVSVGAGADVIITNHSEFDNSFAKLNALATRNPGDPNPYVVGKQTVQRYLTVAEECGKAMLLAAKEQQH